MGLRSFLILCFIAIGISPLQAKEFRFPALSPQKSIEDALPLIIYSTTDIDIISPVLRDFQQTAPDLEIIYHDIQSVDLYERVIAETNNAYKTADLVFSSAMDLQIKLANDGYASSYSPANRASVPSWANWRDEAFGVTVEPVVIVYNKAYFQGKKVPKTRSDLLDLLEDQSDELFGRIATYDVNRSGLGFLFLSRDIELYSATWDLIRAMGRNGLKTYSSTGAILDQVIQGKVVLGYNLLGSYALARSEREENLGVILPEDYTLVMSRIALIPRAAQSPTKGQLFLDYLLSIRGQTELTQKAQLNAVIPGIKGVKGQIQIEGRSLRPIKVGTSLLVYLDQLKRRRLLKNWQRALGPR
ncbi:MAG: ABC transporter substrate-binding protein [Sneathiella sp.]